MCVQLDGYQVVIAVIQVIYNKTAKYSCLNKLCHVFFRKFIEKKKQSELEWGRGEGRMG